jgi:copper resistance protein C
MTGMRHARKSLYAGSLLWEEPASVLLRAEAPNTISITFSEAVEPKFSSIQLTDEKGKPVDSGVSKPAPDDPTTLILPVPKLTTGTYVVHWANVAVDGHRLDGSYKFTVR